MPSSPRRARLFYHRLPDDFSKDEKLTFLSQERLDSVDWQRLRPNTRHTWLRSETDDEFAAYMPIGSKEARRAKGNESQTIFKTYSGGLKSNRDNHIYDFQSDSLSERIREFIADYRYEVFRFSNMTKKPEVDEFVDYTKIAWSSTLKRYLQRGQATQYSHDAIRTGLFRPFTKKALYLDRILIDRPGHFMRIFPVAGTESENLIICCTDVAFRSSSPSALISNCIPNLSICSTTDSHQCFPFYTYHPDGSNRRENITDWALAQFRERYADPNISKWDIFHYVYALLHHPGYRQRYALDLKRSLPRIPFAPDFQAFARAGRQLADLHLTYESAERYELDWQITRSPVDYRVEKMRPGKKSDAELGGYKVYEALKYNDSLTLRGIPERAFAYRLGNRSALEWIVDQYRVKTDKRSGITHDPNGYSDDAQYILKLIERVITVSLRTVDVVEGLARMDFR